MGEPTRKGGWLHDRRTSRRSASFRGQSRSRTRQSRAAVHAAESFGHIGDKGLPICSGTTTNPPPQLREFMALYRERFAAAGTSGRRIRRRRCSVDVRPRDAMRPGVHRYYRNLETIFSEVPESYGQRLPRLQMIRENVANLPFEKFGRDPRVFGDTAEVIDKLQVARDDFGLLQIMCWLDQGNMPPRAEVERTMRRFADEVMPKVGDNNYRGGFPGSS